MEPHSRSLDAILGVHFLNEIFFICVCGCNVGHVPVYGSGGVEEANSGGYGRTCLRIGESAHSHCIETYGEDVSALRPEFIYCEL